MSQTTSKNSTTHKNKRKSISKLFHAQTGFKLVPTWFLPFLWFRLFLPTSQGLFHTKHAAPTTKQYWPSTQGVNKRGIYNIHINIYIYIYPTPYIDTSNTDTHVNAVRQTTKVNLRQTCTSQDTSKTKQQPNRWNHEIAQKDSLFFQTWAFVGSPRALYGRGRQQEKKEVDVILLGNQSGCDPPLVMWVE